MKYIDHVKEFIKQHDAFVDYVKGCHDKVLFYQSQTINLAQHVLDEYNIMKETFNKDQLCPGFVRTANSLNNNIMKVDGNDLIELLDDNCFLREVAIQILDKPFTMKLHSKKEYKKYTDQMNKIKEQYTAFMTCANANNNEPLNNTKTSNLAHELTSLYINVRENFGNEKMCPLHCQTMHVINTKYST